MQKKIQKEIAYVEWDETTSNRENYRRRVKAIVTNYDCRTNADIMALYNQIYPDASKKNKINKLLPDKDLSYILKDEKHYMKTDDGIFLYLDNEDEKLLLELVDVFDSSNGKSYTIKNYEIIIRKTNVLYMMSLLMDKYSTKISNINIQYIKNYASIKITYRILTKVPDVKDENLDVETLDKLLKKIKLNTKK